MGRPSQRAAGPLREGSRLYSYLLRGQHHCPETTQPTTSPRRRPRSGRVRTRHCPTPSPAPAWWSLATRAELEGWAGAGQEGQAGGASVSHTVQPTPSTRGYWEVGRACALKGCRCQERSLLPAQARRAWRTVPPPPRPGLGRPGGAMGLPAISAAPSSSGPRLFVLVPSASHGNVVEESPDRPARGPDAQDGWAGGRLHKPPGGCAGCQHSGGRGQAKSEALPALGTTRSYLRQFSPTCFSQMRELEPREVKGPAQGHTAHGNWLSIAASDPHAAEAAPHPNLPPAPSQRVLCAVHRRYYSHFRKDSRLYSYPIAGQSPKLYNLLPHPKGPSVWAPKRASWLPPSGVGGLRGTGLRAGLAGC